MVRLFSSTRIFLACGTTDMRTRFDGLVLLVQQTLQQTLQQSRSSRQCNLEPTTARLACNAAHVATVLQCNLTDETKTEAIRASGDRSSWEAFASKTRCALINASIRPADWLKLIASCATSSRPSTATRLDRSPDPQASTLV